LPLSPHCRRRCGTAFRRQKKKTADKRQQANKQHAKQPSLYIQQRSVTLSYIVTRENQKAKAGKAFGRSSLGVLAASWQQRSALRTSQT